MDLNRLIMDPMDCPLDLTEKELLQMEEEEEMIIMPVVAVVVMVDMAVLEDADGRGTQEQILTLTEVGRAVLSHLIRQF
jgi:hypothetical protein